MSAVKERGAAFAGAALATLGTIAALAYFSITPTPVEPLVRPSAAPAFEPVATTTPEQIANEAALPASITRQAAPVRQGQAEANDDPPVPPLAIGASAAMRDFGQIVISAFNDGTPEQLSEAVNIMSVCRFNPDLVQHIERMRTDGRLAGEAGDVAINAFNERGRRCQSIPPDLMSRQKELAERALLAGSRKVAAIYGELVGFDPPAAMKGPLRDALRADFFSGDDIAPLVLARHPEVFGLSRIETRAYEISFEALDSTRTSRSKRPRTPFEFDAPTPPYSDDEQKQADLLAQAWLRRVKKPERSPH